MPEQLFTALTQFGAAGAVIWFFLKRDAIREERDSARETELVHRIQLTEDWIRTTLIGVLTRVEAAIRDLRGIKENTQ